MTPTQVRFFAREMFSPPTLLRRSDGTDETFVNGQWAPTKAVVDWMVGSDDFVTEISESQARKLAPAAFAI